MKDDEYALIDTGSRKKLERFGPYLLVRPCPQALWEPLFPDKWRDPSGEFVRRPRNVWKKKELPPSWVISFRLQRFKLVPTDFGHLGIFPEHGMHREKMCHSGIREGDEVLNLFAYSGGATVALAKKKVAVCHVDASSGMVDRAKENVALNGVGDASVRWIVDDVCTFVKREVKRGKRYRGIILDPPTFGRGTKGQVFTVERDLYPLLLSCAKLITDPGRILLTSHTPTLTPSILGSLLKRTQKGGKVTYGETVISSPLFSLPAGGYAWWERG
ncbi:MAG: class I SAM-dependent methyltransferase [Simkaniaceae bacterium]|nr:class I SAM-dependent methyltransferase [Simkaniaceae bacterium]